MTYNPEVTGSMFHNIENLHEGVSLYQIMMKKRNGENAFREKKN